jgi:hypothetical protein
MFYLPIAPLSHPLLANALCAAVWAMQRPLVRNSLCGAVQALKTACMRKGHAEEQLASEWNEHNAIKH